MGSPLYMYICIYAMWHMYINILQLVWSCCWLSLHINNASHPLIAFYLVAFNRIFPSLSSRSLSERCTISITLSYVNRLYIYLALNIYINSFIYFFLYFFWGLISANEVVCSLGVFRKCFRICWAEPELSTRRVMCPD